MTIRTLTGAYDAGYGVQTPTTTLEIGVHAYVGGKGVYTPATDTGAYRIVNAGRIAASEVAGSGVDLGHGGQVVNGASALIEGYSGVVIAGASGTVANSGTIQAVAFGVDLRAGGRVVNGSAADTSAQIQGSNGAGVLGSGVTVENFATVSGATGAEVFGGAVTNGSAGDTSALIQATNGFGVGLLYGIGNSLANFGTVTSVGYDGYAVYASSGAITNGSSLDSSALISGAEGVVTNGVVTVINFGTIQGTSGYGVRLTSAGSRLVAEAGSDFVGDVQGGGGTLELASGSGTLSGLGGAGTLTGGVAMTFSGFGAYQLDAGSSWTLAGTDSLGAGVTLVDHGTLGLIGTLAVDGAISGGHGLTLGAAGAVLALGSGASISGPVRGDGGTLELGAATGTIANLGAAGSISGGAAMAFSGFGAYSLDAGGAWTLEGTSTLGAGKRLTDDASIIGGLTLAAASDRLILGQGGSISGAVAGGGGTLELASGTATLAGLGGAGTLTGSEAMTFSGFGAYEVDGGVSLTLVGSNAIGSGETLTDDGTLTVGAGATLANGGTLAFGGEATLINYGSVTGVHLSGAGERLIAEAGSSFQGPAVGDGGTLELGAATGTIANLGGFGEISGGVSLIGFSGFGAYQIDAGGAWALAGTRTLAGGKTLADFGAITGGLTLSAGAYLVLGAGASVGGAVVGGGGTLELASGAATVSGVGATKTLSGAESATFSGIGAYQLEGGATLTNAGALTSGVTLTAAGARLIAEDGSTFGGAALGGGGTLELGAASGTLANLGAGGTASGGVALTFSGFGSYQLDAGGAWTLAGTATLAAGTSLIDYAAVTGGVSLAAASDRLVLGAGASISGPVAGGGGTLELASGTGTLTGLGGTGTLSGAESMTFSGFGAYVIDAGAAETISGSKSFGAGQGLTDGGAVTNLGTLAGAYGAGATLLASGVLTNGEVSATGATISGSTSGVYGEGAATVINYGAIQSYGDGVDLTAGGSVINGSAGDTAATIAGSVGAYVLATLSAGVTIGGAAGTVTNYGAILATQVFREHAVVLGDGGRVTNGGTSDTTALIQGYSFGVTIYGAAGIVANYGTVKGISIGVALTGGGAVTNGAAGDSGALISGLVGVLAVGPDAVTVTNFGTIVATRSGAVYFESSSDVLILEAGSKVTGTAFGGGGTLELATGTGTITGLGLLGAISGGESATVRGFGAYVTDAGTDFTLAGVNILIAGETLTIEGEATNLGAIESVGDGVRLTAGASLYNAGESAIISGLDGVFASGPASVRNSGSIVALGTTFSQAGVVLSAGGSVVNGSNGDTTATIQAGEGASGVCAYGGLATLANFGVVNGDYGVLLLGGGSVDNGGSRDTSARIQGINVGVGVTNAAGTIANQGTIAGYQGVEMFDGGAVINGSNTDTHAVILGSMGLYESHAFGVGIAGAAGTVRNFGTIKSNFLGVDLGDGGVVINGSETDTSAYSSQIYCSQGTSTVTNFGTTTSVGAGSGNQMVINGSVSDTHALIDSNNVAVINFNSYASDIIENFGVMISRNTHADSAIEVSHSRITNGSLGDTTALVEGFDGTDGIDDTIANFGTIMGFGTVSAIEGLAGISMYGGSTVTNGAGGDTTALIRGFNGVLATYGDDTVTNFGTISGKGGAAVEFESPSDTLVVEAGSRLIGNVLGGGGMLVLASGQGSVSLGQASGGMNETVSGSMSATTFTNFATLEVGTGAAFTITDGAAIEAGQSLVAAGGVLAFAEAISGAGTLVAGSGGTLDVEAAAASTVAMDFAGHGATLALASPASFAATIDGFAAGDAIDLTNIAATSATLGSGDVLTIKNGTQVIASLQLGGSYAGDTFSVTRDHHGGSEITLVAPAAAAPSGSANPSPVPASPAALGFVLALAGLDGGASMAALQGGASLTWTHTALVTPK